MGRTDNRSPSVVRIDAGCRSSTVAHTAWLAVRDVSAHLATPWTSDHGGSARQRRRLRQVRALSCLANTCVLACPLCGERLAPRRCESERQRQRVPRGIIRSWRSVRSATGTASTRGPYFVANLGSGAFAALWGTAAVTEELSAARGRRKTRGP